MDKPEELREMLLQYQLNELDEARREEMDTRLICDAEFSSAMQDVEYDLLDAYAAGELNERDRLRVEQALHPDDRLLIPVPARVPTATAVVPFPERKRLWWQIAGAIAAVAVLAVVAASVRHSSTRPAPQIVQQEAPTVPAVAPQPPAPAVSVKPPVVSLATIVLPAAMRSQNTLTLPISAATGTVRFVWPRNDHAPQSETFLLQVVNEDGVESCRNQGVASTGQTRSLHFDCSTARLASGQGFLRILRTPVEPDAVPVLEVAVSVVKK